MKEYLIMYDSGCDMSENILCNIPVVRVPITLTLQNKNYTDDGNMDLDSFLAEMKACPTSPKSSAPSPALYIQHFNKADKIFIITISSKISSTYNNALLAKKLYHETNPDKFIEVIDTKSASVGGSLVVQYLHNLLQLNIPAAEAAQQTKQHLQNLNTLFVIDDLSNIKKSGRLSHLSSVVASILNIKPLFGDDDGDIVMKEKIRGYRKALDRMLVKIGETKNINFENRILAVAYCKAANIAKHFAQKATDLYNFKDAFTVEMKPTISTFANIKGILISY